jgi:peptidyl-tRNA hydrolase, PTH1 family
MKLIVGLGNPGKKYEKTRHNAGFMAIDVWLKKHQKTLRFQDKFQAELELFHLNGEKVIIMKPHTFMNLSGQAIRKVKDYYQIELEDILVFVDDINLKLGQVRMRELGGHGGQNGLKNIISELQTEQFKRVRLGIDIQSHLPLDQYVLGEFSQDEDITMQPTLLKCADIINEFIESKKFVDLMTKYHTQT